MCARNMMKRPIGQLNLDLAKKIFREIPKGFFWTHGFGEPLLHPQFYELVKMARRIGHQVGAITNGTILDEEMVIRIIDSRLDQLVFSIDGTKEIYEKIRIGAHYDQVKENIQWFKEIKREMGSSLPKLRINLVTQRKNKACIPAFLEEWRPIIPHIRIKNVNDYYDGGQTLLVDVPLRQIRDKVCYALHRGGLMITWDGLVVPCCTMYDAQWVYGNLNEESFDEIWNGDSRQELIQLHESGDYPPVCKWCHRDQLQSRDVR